MTSRKDVDSLSSTNISKQESYMRSIGSTLMRQDSLMDDDELQHNENLAMNNTSSRHESVWGADSNVSKDDERLSEAVRRQEDQGSGDNCRGSALLKSKWLSLSMPAELNDELDGNGSNRNEIFQENRKILIAGCSTEFFFDVSSFLVAE